jgi:transcriptional antiterminator/mannitol/fructose-specific phosphotransferase system IIA component (Ntr-type)
MYLDERSKTLLLEVIKNPHLSSKELQSTYDLSRRQVDYSFKKANEWLEDQGKPQIIKKNGCYQIDKSVLQLFDIEQVEDVEHYIPTQEERVYLLILYIVTSEEELSLNHFISEMEVSKNTILQDLRDVRSLLDSKELSLEYTRQDGYYTVGSEWNKRSMMLEAIYKVSQMYGGEQFFKRFMDISEEAVQSIKQQLTKIERELQLSFVDAELECLPYAVEGIFKRMRKGRKIDTDFFINNSELSDTREYAAVNILIEDKKEVPEEERLYLALQLLTSNTVQKDKHLDDQELPRLRQALRETLNEFERKAVFPIVNKEELVDKLFLHFKPAYYRIKYHLTTDYRPLEKISEEFEMLHYFVKESVAPLVQFLECDIPEKEIMFITLFVGGHIIEHNEQSMEEAHKRAIVVCPNGLSVSKLMERNLRSIFPEIYFYPAMSVREFKDSDVEFDLVFSSVPITIPSDKRLFVVNQMMDETERNHLRKVVMRSVFLFDEQTVDVEGLMDVINAYAEVNNEKALLSSLKSFLKTENPVTHVEPIYYGHTLHLDALLSKEMIQIVEGIDGWQEALSLAAQPLIENEKIVPKYVAAIKEEYPDVAEHIVLQGNIAIPHSDTDKGVQELGMSLLFMKEGIPNFNGSMLHFIVVIAAIDRKAHFTALMELMELAGSEETLEKMKQSNTSEEIAEIIACSIKEKRRAG